jgi:hypothetical protein
MNHSDNIDIQKHQRQEARWLILRVLYAGQPIGASEKMIIGALADASVHIDTDVVHRELAYLEDKGLLKVDDQVASSWYAKLTAAGSDVVEYVAPAPAGIARPVRR